MATQALPTRPTGRPPKREGSVPTRDRLIAAAIDVFVERGFGQASIGEIAAKADISGPAVYKHFSTKTELLVAAARHSLDTSLASPTGSSHDPIETATRWLSPKFRRTRKLLLELHLSAGREADLSDMLAQWHLERAEAWQAATGESIERIKVFYLLLLGIAQLDSLDSLDADTDVVRMQVLQLVTTLFNEPMESP